MVLELLEYYNNIRHVFLMRIDRLKHGFDYLLDIKLSLNRFFVRRQLDVSAILAKAIPAFIFNATYKSRSPLELRTLKWCRIPSGLHMLKNLDVLFWPLKVKNNLSVSQLVMYIYIYIWIYIHIYIYIYIMYKQINEYTCT